MKTQTISFAKLETSEVENLVKETVAVDQHIPHNKPFLSVADLWNIQKMTRPRVTRRFLI